MTEADARNSLQAIREELVGILESDSANVIEEALAQLARTKRRYDQSKDQTHHIKKEEEKEPNSWGYQVADTKPLRFQPSICNDNILRADVLCNLRWSEQGLLTQEIALRVWALDKDLMFRKQRDSVDVSNYLNHVNSPERVVFRCHFDLANEFQAGPKTHLQLGGSGELKEQCWFPDSIKIPRFAYPPMDLLLVCQMVAAKFFPKEYLGIKDKGAWRKRVADSEQLFWRPYYEQCLQHLDSHKNNTKTWLDEFWNKQRP